MKKLLIITILFLGFHFYCNAQNAVSTYSGSGTAGLQNGIADSSQYNEPFGICKDTEGNLFIADGGNHCIRKIDMNGISSIYAGTGEAGFADGILETAQFNNPTNVCFDNSGNLLVADFLNHRIRKISPSGEVSTVAGSGTDGFKDGIAVEAQFNYPRGLAVDSLGNIYVADSWNHRIRKIDGTTFEVSTFAGNGFNIGVGSVGNLIDGQGLGARFYTPSGLTIDHKGNLYVADPFNHRIRKIDTDRNVTTYAGSGTTGPNNGDFADGDALTARLHTPTDLLWTESMGLLIADTYNNRVRWMQDSSMMATIAGNGNAGFVNDVDSLAEFDFPRGIAINSNGDSIFVVDYNNHSIRIIHLDIFSSVQAISDNLEEVEIFPNPSTNKIRIRLKEWEKPLQVGIYNAVGKLVFEGQMLSKEIEIDSRDFLSGVHIVVLERGKEKTSYRLVIE